jgi:phage head maturation protease
LKMLLFLGIVLAGFRRADTLKEKVEPAGQPEGHTLLKVIRLTEVLSVVSRVAVHAFYFGF